MHLQFCSDPARFPGESVLFHRTGVFSPIPPSLTCPHSPIPSPHPPASLASRDRPYLLSKNHDCILELFHCTPPAQAPTRSFRTRALCVRLAPFQVGGGPASIWLFLFWRCNLGKHCDIAGIILNVLSMSTAEESGARRGGDTRDRAAKVCVKQTLSKI